MATLYVGLLVSFPGQPGPWELLALEQGEDGFFQAGARHFENPARGLVFEFDDARSITLWVPKTWRERRALGRRYLHLLIARGVQDVYTPWRALLDQLGHFRDPACATADARYRLTGKSYNALHAWGIFEWARLPYVAPGTPDAIITPNSNPQ